MLRKQPKIKIHSKEKKSNHTKITTKGKTMQIQDKVAQANDTKTQND